MPMTRRSLLIAASVLPGCTVQVPTPPQKPTGQISAGDPMALSANEGIVVGVGLMVYAAKGERFRRDAYGRTRNLILASSGSRDPYYIPITGSGANAERTENAEAVIEATPFAFRLPAGRSGIVGHEIYDLTSYTLYSNRADRTHGWVRTRLLPLGFDVAQGEVTYIGRVGWLDGRVSFPDAESLAAACPERRRVSTILNQDCLLDYPVYGSDPDGDLLLLRKAFPALADRPVRRDAPTSVRGWARWPGALGNPLGYYSTGT